LRRLTDDDRGSEWNGFLRKNPKANWVFFEFGNKPGQFPLAICEEDIMLFGCDRVFAEVNFDKDDSNRFEVVWGSRVYLSQGYLEKLQQEDPKQYKDLLSRKRGKDDISHPDDIFFEIGKCGPF
jgi:hypothetical protein